MAAVDYFLKIEGVDGESTDDKHKGEIDIESFSWGVSQMGTGGHGGGGGAGKASFQDLHFHTHINKSSPKLFLACATGEHFKKAVLTCRKAGKEQQEYLKITLSDVLVSSYQDGGGSGGVIPTDQFSLNFAKIEFEYKPQKADGTLDSAVKAGYDVAANKKV
jgi:type VI secretion system secreted protein Hcp